MDEDRPQGAYERPVDGPPPVGHFAWFLVELVAAGAGPVILAIDPGAIATNPRNASTAIRTSLVARPEYGSTTARGDVSFSTARQAAGSRTNAVRRDVPGHDHRQAEQGRYPVGRVEGVPDTGGADGGGVVGGGDPQDPRDVLRRPRPRRSR